MAKARVIAREIATEGPPPTQRKVAVVNGDGQEIGKVEIEKIESEGDQISGGE